MTFQLKPGVTPATLSSPLAYFNFNTTITRNDTGAVIVAWARANMDDARREPILSRVRSAVLSGDFARARTLPSRLGGTYRVTMSGGDSSVTWQFRTVDRPAYRVPEWEDSRTLDDLLASPYSSGYSLLGYPADSTGALPSAAPRPDPRAVRALVWLKAGDRLTSPEARSDSVLTGELEFTRAALPTAIWRALDAFVAPVDSLTLALRARTGRAWTDGDDQA